MVRLKPWQWVVLASPIVAIATFLMVMAGIQLRDWGLNWIWAVFIFVLVGWRWLLVRWTRPAFDQVEAIVAEVNQDLETAIGEANLANGATSNAQMVQQIEAQLQTILVEARNDPPAWEDWGQFWQRCREIVIAIAHVYHPEVKYPLLNIYVPQAYGLIRGTVDDMDAWMGKLSPVLGQVTVGQAYQAYEVYQKLEPSARKVFRIWNWAQWVLNPAAAIARETSKSSSNQATQQLIVNLSQTLREAALRNLARQTVLLYGGDSAKLPNIDAIATSEPTATLPKAKTKTLRALIEQAEPQSEVEQANVSILLVGRTGAGKSSIINTLFQADKAEVDVLPSTDQIQSYQWQTKTGESLCLWDTPGYEQVQRRDLRSQVIDYAHTADLLLLVTPALDPALQMDVDFLRDFQQEIQNLPTIAIVTQVDRLRPVREWQPPYDWQWGNRTKEKSIREATAYRREALDEMCDRVLPLVTWDEGANRSAWNADQLSLALIESLDSAKQLRLARFLRDRDTRVVAAAKIIDQYTVQMTTTQGVTALLKSPILQFLSTLTTGSPALAYLLAEQIPVERLPIVIGKLQMAYDLFSLLSAETDLSKFDLLALWPLLLEHSEASPDRDAWAFGHALVEYWTQRLTVNQLRQRIEYYLSGERNTPNDPPKSPYSPSGMA